MFTRTRFTASIRETRTDPRSGGVASWRISAADFLFSTLCAPPQPGDGVLTLSDAAGRCRPPYTVTSGPPLGLVRCEIRARVGRRDAYVQGAFRVRRTTGKRGKGIDTPARKTSESFAFWPELKRHCFRPAQTTGPIVERHRRTKDSATAANPKDSSPSTPIPKVRARRSRNIWSKGRSMRPRMAWRRFISRFLPNISKDFRSCWLRRCPFTKSVSASVTTSRSRCRNPRPTLSPSIPTTRPSGRTTVALLVPPCGPRCADRKPERDRRRRGVHQEHRQRHHRRAARRHVSVTKRCWQASCSTFRSVRSNTSRRSKSAAPSWSRSSNSSRSGSA